MRVAWKEDGGTWFAYIGRCSITVRQMDWYHPEARERRETFHRTWIYSVRHHAEDFTSSQLTEGIFEVPGDYGTETQAQAHAVAIAREFVLCKRRPRLQRKALEPESVAWLEERLLETLRTSYTDWRKSVANVKRLAEEGDRWAQQALWDLRKIYPEPKWSTAQLAAEAAQYHRPDDLDVTDKRFYVIVRSALDRLKRRKLIAASTGLDDEGRETTLWEPV